jgi:hypothetical protein
MSKVLLVYTYKLFDIICLNEGYKTFYIFLITHKEEKKRP